MAFAQAGWAAFDRACFFHAGDGSAAAASAADADA